MNPHPTETVDMLLEFVRVVQDCKQAPTEALRTTARALYAALIPRVNETQTGIIRSLMAEIRLLCFIVEIDPTRTWGDVTGWSKTIADQIMRNACPAWTLHFISGAFGRSGVAILDSAHADFQTDTASVQLWLADNPGHPFTTRFEVTNGDPI